VTNERDHMELYLDTELKFEKLGMEVMLSEDPNDWPTQILDELLRQVPYTSDFSPKVVLPTVDADRRYALGQVELSNKLAINPRDDSTPAALKGSQKACIPVIVQDGRMKPLDLLLSDGKTEPLTEERLRRAMFRPQLFEAVRERPGDMSMIEQLYPPHRQYGGARGPLMADIGSSGASKEGSAKPEYLMDALMPSVQRADVASMIGLLEKDAAIGHAAVHNGAMAHFIETLMHAGEGTRKVASAGALEVGERTVVQLLKLAEGYRIKMANPDSMAPPAQADVSRPEATQALGPEMVNEADQNGQATAGPPEQQQDLAQAEPFQLIQQFGKYRVSAQPDNMALTGWVFPHVVDWDGSELSTMLFTDGEFSAMGSGMAGSPLETTEQPLDVPPVGEGVFYFEAPDGPIALAPVSVDGSVVMGGALAFRCTDSMGQQFLVRKVPGLQAVSQIDATTFGVPAEAKFAPWGEDVEIMGGPTEEAAVDEASKVAQARVLPMAVRVFTDQDGRRFSFDGQPIDKLAGVLRTNDVSKDEAIFLGAVLGQDPVKFAADLSSMRKKGSYDGWFKARPVAMAPTGMPKVAEAVVNKVSAVRGGTDHILLKEATAIDDPIAVDKILSLGFITPENVAVFASYIPEIETVIRRLAELLVAARLGLHSVDEGAIQRSLVHLDKVVAGLKTVDSDAQ
jgi:hypothetical protein